MRIFMTGATGTIGGSVAAALHAKGHQIIALARTPQRATQLKGLGYQPVLGDMRTPDGWIDQAAQADALIHTAWIRPGRRMNMRWLRAATAADQATVRGLIQAARQSNHCQALLLTSGVSVYGDHGSAWIDEETAVAPGALGGKQLACERLGLQAAHEGLPVIVLRPAGVYGPRGALAEYFFGSAARGAIRYPGTGENFFPVVRDTDLAQAYVLALEKRPVGQILTIVDDEPLPLKEVARLVVDQFGGGRAEGVPRWLVSLLAGRPLAEMIAQSMRVRNAKARSVLGWQPTYATFRAGVVDAARAYRATVSPEGQRA